MKEIYKDIPNMAGYKASNLGNIKSYLTDKNGKILKKREDKNGYYMVWTKYNSAYKVHRAVAQTFLKNDDSLLVVNHKNGNVKDNRLENLEWCTIVENTQHAYDTGLAKSPMSIKVGIYHDGDLISYSESVNKLTVTTFLDRNSLANAIKENTSIYDELFVKKLPKDFEDSSLLDRPFLKHKLARYQVSPVSHNGVKYESIDSFSNHKGISRGQVTWALRNNKKIDGFPLLKISRYNLLRIKLND